MRERRKKIRPKTSWRLKVILLIKLKRENNIREVTGEGKTDVLRGE